MDLPWIVSAEKYVGQKEVPGLASNYWILDLWKTIPWIWATVVRKDDSLLAWCAAFIRLIFVECGITPPKAWWRAVGYAEFGVEITYPARGAIGILRNKKGQHHIGIVMGRTEHGDIVMLGGNQDNQVKYSAFKAETFIHFRWPIDDVTDLPKPYTLPTYLGTLLSKSEL